MEAKIFPLIALAPEDLEKELERFVKKDSLMVHHG